MQNTPKKKPGNNPIRRKLLIGSGGLMLLLAIILLGAFAGAGVWAIFHRPAAGAVDEDTGGWLEMPNRVGIVSGHFGNDSGAVCANGLAEADINHRISLLVIQLLRDKGYEADLLDEFDGRLTGYKARALVSIHADSCTIPGATGFKAARVTDSAIPSQEDDLVNCLNKKYQKATGLPRHPGSITDDMTNYHAFREIDKYTPGAIIETGFMLDDARIIVEHPEKAADGIVRGILCFLEGDSSD